MAQEIFCCGCSEKVIARLTNGAEIYPHRPDLHNKPFWICDTCKNYVGCHHKTSNPTKPLGCIPTPEVMNARKHIHAILDPLWQSGMVKRKRIYGMLSIRIGYQYHTGNIRSIEEAREIYKLIKKYAETGEL